MSLITTSVIAHESPLPYNTQQLILVITEDWHTTSGTLHRYQKFNQEDTWQEIGEAIPIIVGKNGLAWGRGLHPNNISFNPQKQEGDGKSPAGIFKLGMAFGIKEKIESIKLPYQVLLPTIECIDDSHSEYYNNIVDLRKITKPDWKSSEKMLEIGDPYYLGMIVEHNTKDRIAGHGSCIFLHIWRNAKTATHGCTAMPITSIKKLLQWLDPTKNPVLVQLPAAEYKSFKAIWALP